MGQKRPQRVEAPPLRDGFRREITFLPAYDLRDPDPEKNCGVHGVELAFHYGGSGLNAEPVYEKLLVGGDGAVWAELESYYDLIFRSEEPLG